MKNFIKWLSALILTVVVVDFIIGVSFDKYIQKHTLPGDYESIEKVLRHYDADLLVLGSSVALNSIDNNILGDSLNLTTFNGGGNGQTFPFFLTMLKSATVQHIPQSVILCIQPSTFTGESLGKRYNFLVPYYGYHIADIDENINKIRPHNDILMKSTALKLNTIWFRILLYHFISPDIRGENGHISKPLPPVYPTKTEVSLGRMSPERMDQFLEFLNICRQNNIQLTILFTPEFVTVSGMNDQDNVIYQVREISEPYGVRVYYDTELEPFNSNAELFYDNSHLNVKGTEIYTDTILNRLR